MTTKHMSAATVARITRQYGRLSPRSRALLAQHDVRQGIVTAEEIESLVELPRNWREVR